MGLRKVETAEENVVTATVGRDTDIYGTGNVNNETNDRGKTEVEDIGLWRYKMAQTLSLVVLWILMGTYSTLITVALPDLRHRLCVGTDELSAAMSLKSIGALTGGILGGIIVDRFRSKSNLILALSLMLVGTSVMIQPWSRLVEVLGLLFTLEGLGQAGNALVLALWGNRADPALHAIHFGYTVGMVITPLIASPFLSPDVTATSNCTYTDSSNVTMYITTCIDDVTTQPSDTCPDDNSRIEIPYFLAGGLTASWSLVFWILFVKGPPQSLLYHSESKSRLRDVFSPGSCADGDSCFAVWFVSVFTLFMVLMTGTVIPIFSFSFTYLRDNAKSLDISLAEATLFALALNVSQMIGRALGIIISHVCPIQVLLMSEIILTAASVTVLVFFGLSEKYVFLVSVCWFGLVISPAWPGGFAFVDKYITLYAVVLAIAGLGAGLAGFVFTWISGHLYDNVSHDNIFHLSMGSAMALLLVTIIMQVTGARHGNRHRKVKDAESSVSDVYASTAALVPDGSDIIIATKL